MLQKIIDEEDTKKIYAQFKKIVLMSFGVRSEDGKKFIRNDQLREEFENSEAFSELIVEILSDADKASEFINGISPKGSQTEATAVSDTPIAAVAEAPTPRELSPAEIVSMDRTELSSGLAEGRYVLAKEDNYGEPGGSIA